MALNLFLPSLVAVSVTGKNMINLDFPLGLGVKKSPTPYLGFAGLTPFLGLNPYLRSLTPVPSGFSPALMPFDRPAPPPPLGLYHEQRLSLFGSGYANGEYCAFDSACASKDCYYFSCSPSLKTGEKCKWDLTRKASAAQKWRNTWTLKCIMTIMWQRQSIRDHRDCAIRDCRRSGCAAGIGESCFRFWWQSPLFFLAYNPYIFWKLIIWW